MTNTRVAGENDMSSELVAVVARMNSTLRLPSVIPEYDHNDGKLRIHGLEYEASMGLEQALHRAGIYCTSHEQQPDGLHTLSVNNEALVDRLIAAGLNVRGSEISRVSHVAAPSRLELVAMQGLAKELNDMRLEARKSDDGGLILKPRDAIHRATLEAKLHASGIVFVDEPVMPAADAIAFKLTSASQVDKLIRAGLNLEGGSRDRTL